MRRRALMAGSVVLERLDKSGDSVVVSGEELCRVGLCLFMMEILVCL